MEKIVIHQNFSQKTWVHDIALIKFSAPEESSKTFVHLCLPSSEADFKGSDCTLSGWGRTSFEGPYSDILQTISVTIFKEEECKNSYKNIFNIFSDHMFCAGDLKGVSGPCVGDSGSPLQCFNEKSKKWILKGITSWGFGCAKENYPAVYIRVSYYLNWINNIIHDS
ncbi:UNVERIFIED_CONTAM: hypothetical protein RMT77_011951 [Armadillidium vulgare]